MSQFVCGERNFGLAQSPLFCPTLVCKRLGKCLKIIANDDTCNIRDIASTCGTSHSWMHVIVKCILKVRNISDGQPIYCLFIWI